MNVVNTSLWGSFWSHAGMWSGMTCEKRVVREHYWEKVKQKVINDYCICWVILYFDVIESGKYPLSVSFGMPMVCMAPLWWHLCFVYQMLESIYLTYYIAHRCMLVIYATIVHISTPAPTCPHAWPHPIPCRSESAPAISKLIPLYFPIFWHYQAIVPNIHICSCRLEF